jgi:hypothetical protein
VTNFSSDNYPLVDNNNIVLKVWATEPYNNEILVSMYTSVNITFSEKMDKKTIIGNITLTPKTEVLNYSWSDKDRRVSLELPKLLNGTTYYVKFRYTAIKNTLGKPMKYPYKFRFTTIDPYNYRRPFVLKYTPNGTNVSLTSIINITFNEPIHTPSLENAITIMPFISADINLVNDRHIIISPYENLTFDTVYNVSVSTQIVNLINRSLKVPFNFSFKTESDTYPPFVLDHYPSGLVKVPLDLDNISIIFNEPVDRISVQERFNVSPRISGNYSWLDDNRSFNYEISEELIQNTTYNINLDSGFMDLFENPSVTNFTFSIRSIMFNESIDDPDDPDETDKSPPYVVEHFPSSQTLIPVDLKQLIITFNESVNITSVEERFKISPPVMGSFVWRNNNKTLQYQLLTSLLYSTNYSVKLLPGYMDRVGNQNLEQFEFWFKTIQGISPFEIIDFSPKGNNNTIDSEIMITFNKKPDYDAIVKAFRFKPSINGTMSLEDTTFVFRPDYNLSYNTTYFVTIGKYAKDINGVRLNSTFTWNFTTIFKGGNDTDPPGPGPIPGPNNNTGNETDDSDSAKDGLDYLLVFGIVIVAVIVVIIILIILLSRIKRKKDTTTTDDERSITIKKPKQKPKK